MAELPFADSKQVINDDNQQLNNGPHRLPQIMARILPVKPIPLRGADPSHTAVRLDTTGAHHSDVTGGSYDITGENWLLLPKNWVPKTSKKSERYPIFLFTGNTILSANGHCTWPHRVGMHFEQAVKRRSLPQTTLPAACCYSCGIFATHSHCGYVAAAMITRSIFDIHGGFCTVRWLKCRVIGDEPTFPGLDKNVMKESIHFTNINIFRVLLYQLTCSMQ